MLIFISFCSKQRFDLFSAKLRYFQHYVSEDRLFLVFVRKLYFRPLILSKTCFGVLAMKSKVSGILLQKNSDFVCRCLIPFFGPHSSDNTFLFAGNKIALLWALYYEKKRFSFFVAWTRCTQLYSTKNMFSFVCCNIGLLHEKKSSSMQLVTLIFTWFYSNNVFAFFWLSYAVSQSSFWGQPCSRFP